VASVEWSFDSLVDQGEWPPRRLSSAMCPRMFFLGSGRRRHPPCATRPLLGEGRVMGVVLLPRPRSTEAGYWPRGMTR